MLTPMKSSSNSFKTETLCLKLFKCPMKNSLNVEPNSLLEQIAQSVVREKKKEEEEERSDLFENFLMK